MTFKRSNIEKQVLDLPQEVKWCKKCVISNQRPRIYFNEEGVCSACVHTNYKNSIVNWEEREQEFVELLNKHRRSDGYWDVIVPSSGGKDSGFVAHQLRYKYDMNPLTITWSPLEYTDIGLKNFRAHIDSGLSNILCTPNGKFQRKLARLCFEELGDAFHVFVLGQLSYPLHMAIQLGVDLIFYGENSELEYAGNPELHDDPMSPVTLEKKNNLKGVSFRELLDFGLKNKDYLNEEDFCKADLAFYESPTAENLEKIGIKGRHWFSYYHKWIPQENYYYCVENTGFQPNQIRSEGTYSKYASLDDKMDGMHFFLRYIKFGLGRCVDDAAHEVRDGHITREEGVALMQLYDGEFPQLYYQDFLKYLDISEKHFWEVVDSWRAPHLWEKVEGKWKLKHPIF